MEETQAWNKQVLVCIDERKRSVSFSTSPDPKVEAKSLRSAIKEAYSNVLCGDADATDSDGPMQLILQIKDESWGGEFVDVQETATVPHHSVLRVVQCVSLTSFQ